jgi:hypothetical protein
MRTSILGSFLQLTYKSSSLNRLIITVFCNEFSNLYSFDSNYGNNYSSWSLKGLRKKLSMKKFENLNLCTSMELSSYNVAVEKRIFWQQPYKVDELMQDFLNRKINDQRFCDLVFGFRHNLMIARDKFLGQLGAREVRDFQPDPRSKKLSDFLYDLLCYCDDFMEDYENHQFSNVMQSGFLNFKKALNEE